MAKTKKTTRSKKTVKVTKGLLAYHIAASLVSITQHPHTGRAIHHRHTSHGVLLVGLIITGILLFNNIGALRAFGLSSSGSSTITVNVSGAAPTVGSDITFPATDTTTKSSLLQVTGTCPAGILVATYNNGIFAGSSICRGDGTYANTVQLVVGINTLQSQDYDGLNQPGPTTSQVSIIREQDPIPVTSIDPEIPIIAKTPADVSPTVIPNVVPAPQPSVNPCFDTSKTDKLNPLYPTIIANCIQRSVFTGDTVTISIRIAGGTQPNALSIDWGDGMVDLETVLDNNYHNYQHVYRTAGIIGITFKTKDATGMTSFLQTVVQVNNTAPASAGGTSNIGTIIASFRTIWTEAPVPLYVAAVTLVLGFWVGDIFQRLFAEGSRNIGFGRNKKPPTSFNRHRHA